ncbi:class I SAM-dependent methyltransferase [Rickettsiales endosymbiont of Stachyamoeba lipophora]|uniref:class I SAM-dependent methyltransferase n=1 Tax=Rickettsiales endosymbiont of Stachyamoeba lipophora TaxID=2486578 RepID=UPI000F64A7E9|nr:methyltransferase domain-containing protein [Rickettsiales endosymbiont of Stachyamoeba lipophora]AZL16073.1 methyltransferase domain-containing protein [Rickettsiales endosymbiont of Stachyamoeba lipophora]
MSTDTAIKHGDFTGLAEDYSKYRPGYSYDVINAIEGYIGKGNNLTCADVGAGTGIWTRILANQFSGKIYAVEPNEDMRTHGMKDSQNLAIEWIDGAGENTNLPSHSLDLVSMASSFHWVNFNQAIEEFHRILKPGGTFVAIWNPRVIEYNPLFIEIESYLNELRPNISRVSSGSSEFVNNLASKLSSLDNFEKLLYLEGYHTQTFTKDSYIGVWNSVNDIRHQIGEENFTKFIAFIDKKIDDNQQIEVLYKTRAWVISKK